MSIITLNVLSKAIANKVGVDIEEARRDANIVLDIFGFDDRVIDNLLNHEERQLFYILEEEGMLATDHEITILYNGTEWRTHYWVFKKNNILEYARNKINCTDDSILDESIWDISDESIYTSLTRDKWNLLKNYNF
jgi:hypothetical protein